jgi:hypothetical protein
MQLSMQLNQEWTSKSHATVPFIACFDCLLVNKGHYQANSSKLLIIWRNSEKKCPKQYTIVVAIIFFWTSCSSVACSHITSCYCACANRVKRLYHLFAKVSLWYLLYCSSVACSHIISSYCACANRVKKLYNLFVKVSLWYFLFPSSVFLYNQQLLLMRKQSQEVI